MSINPSGHLEQLFVDKSISSQRVSPQKLNYSVRNESCPFLHFMQISYNPSDKRQSGSEIGIQI